MDSLDPNGLGWHKAEIDGSWIKGVSNGGFKSIQDNPQYLLELKDADDNDDIATCLVSLLQIGGKLFTMY